MKRLKLWNLDKQDRLALSFEGSFDRQAALERELEPFLQALEACTGEWMVDA